MSRGRKTNRSGNDKTFTGTHGGDGGSTEVSKLAAMMRGPVSVQDRLVGPSQTEMRRAISNGECPFCGNRYKNIAVHTNRAHGVDSFQLKDMAGIPKSHPVCTPELSQTNAEISRRRYAEDPTRSRRALRQKGNRRSFSKAGREVQRQKALNLSPETIQKIGQANTAMRRAASIERDQLIVEMVGAGASMADIREATGAGNNVIKHALKFYGADVDLRSRREITVTPEQLDAAKRVRLANLECQASERLARWAELGKEYSTVHVCAAEWGIAAKQAAGWLRKHGEVVPDGRAGSPLDPSECGTERNHRKHRRDGEKPCRPCQNAFNHAHAVRMRRQSNNS